MRRNKSGIMIKLGIIGSGSWSTALAKILTDSGHHIQWWIRNDDNIKLMQQKRHNPHYLSSVEFNMSLVTLSSDIKEVVKNADVLVLGVPSAYVEATLSLLSADDLKNKKIISAIKGLVPGHDILLNDFLYRNYHFPLENYFAVLGPCHAEEVAAEKLSYLTISGYDIKMAEVVAGYFNVDYIRTVVNQDILGVQYAAVLKNIYALGTGIAKGLDYGDNFLSVFIANCADEMAGFLKKFGAQHIVVGEHSEEDPVTHVKMPSYAASVYLGDLLVTCYSLYSRNRSFGNMIGKGYSVQAAQLELNMVAEGYHASKCIHNINQTIGAEIPIAHTIYEIVWQKISAAKGFKAIEEVLV